MNISFCHFIGEKRWPTDREPCGTVRAIGIRVRLTLSRMTSPQRVGSGGPLKGCMDCGSVNAGVGSIRTHPTSPRVGSRRRRQWK